ncbi:hypothetical protein EC841_101284 [Raoultella ornithinolytica]|uniref:Uncharacterized protein n=1 Tax=Raoultella ornithinolytica TaxID=54291 RepID=A0ABD7QNU9_RAOOR|nr:hypothetical protein EC841_101284 [Raoultella ornithinolytica]
MLVISLGYLMNQKWLNTIFFTINIAKSKKIVN